MLFKQTNFGFKLGNISYIATASGSVQVVYFMYNCQWKSATLVFALLHTDWFVYYGMFFILSCVRKYEQIDN